MNICFDLDSTLVDLQEPIKKIFKKHNIKYYPAIDWGMHNYPENIRKEIYKMFANPDAMCNLKPFPYARKCIDYLINKGHHVIIVTSRHDNIKEKTIEMVDNLFNVKCIVVPFGKSKLDVLLENKISLYVDDCSNNLVEYTLAGIRCILISNKETQYNYAFRPCVTWVKNIKKFYKWFKKEY